MLVEVVDQKHFIAEFYHLKVENPIVCDLFTFTITQMRGRDPVWATFCITVKLLSTFPIAVH